MPSAPKPRVGSPADRGISVAQKNTRQRAAQARLAQAARIEDLEARVLLAVGGGFTNAGITGDYFNNTALSGTASFSRKDARIDFDWGTTVKPGGSLSAGFRDLGTDNYSARWTGRIIPRFSETYTFKTLADDGVRLYVKPITNPTWGTSLIDGWSNSGSTLTSTGTMALTAGVKYDIKLEYKELTGSAVCRLLWSSPSTPQEVIDTVAQSGINNPDWTAGYTDIIKAARNSWEATHGGAKPAMDAQGWPLGDGSYVFQESLNQGLDVDPLMLGTVTFSFKGKADVSVWGNVETGVVSYTYNATTNTTSGSFKTANKRSNASYFHFWNSDRDGTGPGTTKGITDLKLMRPTAPNATTSYPADGSTIFTPQLKDAMSHFTVIRHQYVANQQKEWSDRTLPGYFNQHGGQSTNPYYGNGPASSNGAAWEYKVMLANETGRDLMISIPTVASGRTAADTASYVYKLACLIKNGSDGVEPYTSPQANPVYPGLNPNLRVYFEIENELWNWASVFAYDYRNINSITAADADANNADFQAINYDNLPLTKDVNGAYNSMGTWRFRKIMLRTMQMSDIFRSVFGDGDMMTRIRPLYEWQYDNQNDTARMALVFADRYFNNGDGQAHVPTPHPVNHWLWGGGGAAYYGAVNGNGLTTLLPDSDFETPALPTAGYTQAPAGAPWTFTGTAGIAKTGGTADGICPAYNGTQMGYITDKGSISINVTFPTDRTSDYYGLAFKALNRIKSGGTAVDKENLRVYLDDTIDITARTYSQGNGYTATGYDAGHPWQAQNVSWTWSQYYATKGFSVLPGSTHKITIKGMGDIGTPTNTDQTVFLEDVRITSVDKIFTDGIPGGGEATGQPTGQKIQAVLNVETNWAKAYGLEEVEYESGWSLGGDDGGSWIQLKAKYGDPRTADAQIKAMDMFHLAGAAVNVFGTYAQWPNWSDFYAEQGLLNAGQYPIVQGIDDRMNNLPVEAINGTMVPAVMGVSNITLNDSATTSTGAMATAGGWFTWNILVPQTGTYTIKLTTTGTGGQVVLLADDQITLASGATGGDLTGTTTLTKGLHVIKVRRTTGSTFNVARVTVTQPGAPAAPVLNSVQDGDGQATLNWSTVSGATGYKIRYGTASGGYSVLLDAGALTTATIGGLTNNQSYYFVVVAYNASGDSLPSNEKGIIPLAYSQIGTVLGWDFVGYVGTEVSAPVTSNSSRLTVSALTRGSGLRPTTYDQGIAGNSFSSCAQNNVYGLTLAAAITNQQYYQFTLTPIPGRTVSLTQLSFLPYFQNISNGGRGAGITYSTNGTTFSSGIVATGTPVGSVNGNTNPFTVDLSGQASLQNTANAITIRIYLFGNGNYEFTGIGGVGNDIALTGSFNVSRIDGTSAPDTIRLVRDAADSTKLNVFVNDPDTPAYVLVYSTLTSLPINGLAGDDLLIVDFTNGTPVPPGGLPIDGGTHTLADTLSIIGSASADTVTLTPTSAILGASTIAYSNVQSLLFDGQGGNDTLTASTPVQFPATQHLASLTLNTGAVVSLAPGADKFLRTAALTINGGNLDLANNTLVLDYTSTNPLVTTQNWVKSGMSGNWTGSGIISSNARTATRKTLAVVDNAIAHLATINGEAVGSNAIIVKYTLKGDATVDNSVDISDYSAIDNGFLAHNTLSGWSNGDFNYDNTIDIADYSLIDDAFLNQAAAAPALNPAATPATAPLAAQPITLTDQSDAVTDQPLDLADLQSL